MDIIERLENQISDLKEKLREKEIQLENEKRNMLVSSLI